MAEAPQGDTSEPSSQDLDRACRTVLDLLRPGETTWNALRTAALSAGVPAELFERAVPALLAGGLARATTTGLGQIPSPNGDADPDLMLLAATNDARDAQVVAFGNAREPTARGIKAAMLRFLAAAEAGIDERIDRIPNEASRDQARSLGAPASFDWPTEGVPLDDLQDYVRWLFPRVQMEWVPERGGRGPGWVTPEWLLAAIAEVHPVAGDRKGRCPVREYFAERPFPAKGEFARCLKALIETKQVRVSEFRPSHTDNDAGWLPPAQNDMEWLAAPIARIYPVPLPLPHGPVFRMRQESERETGSNTPRPNDTCTLTVAVQEFKADRATLQRAIKRGELPSYRPPGAARNSPHQVSRGDVAARWPRRGR